MNELHFESNAALAYASQKPELSATIKQDPEDFKVDEELGFVPTGSGEHLFLRIAKRNLSTTDVVSLLSRSFKIAGRDIGYAGMKDRRAVTSQWFSVRLSAEEDANLGELETPEGADAIIVDSIRNSRKLKIGSHRLNYFQLVLKDVVGNKDELEQKLNWLQTNGFPNYYGSQRFGKEMSNLKQAQTLFESSSASGKGKSARSKKRTGMLYSAARSYLFNQILSERVRQGSWNEYVPGDVLNLDGTARLFNVEPDSWNEELEQRLISLDIHPTGLLCGAQSAKENYATCGSAADIEDAIVASFPSLAEGLMRHGLQAGRRPLRTRVTDIRWQWIDSSILSLHFSLPRGAYATSLLRELCHANAH